MDMQTPWVKYGLYLGVSSIIITLISYYVFPLGMWYQMLLGLGLIVLFMVLASREQRNLNEGILSYGEALKCNFLTGIVSTLLSGIFVIILVQLIDPGLTDVIKERALESTRSMMEKFGASEDVIQEALDKSEESMENSMSVGAQIINIFTSAIIVLIFAAIISIFVKKEEPTFE